MDQPDEFELTTLAGRMLQDAETSGQQRAAMLTWLRGARLQVSPDGSDTGPVDLLISALESLDLGHTMAVLKRAKVTPPSNPTVEAARGRAIATVDYLIARQMPLDEATSAVEQAIGVKRGRVKRWRETSRSERHLHASAAAHVRPTLEHWAFLDDLPTKVSLGGVASTILERLILDRPIHLAG